MANTTFATQNYPSEGGKTIWHQLSPSIPQQGTITTNKGAVPSANDSNASATYVGRTSNPHMPPSWKVK